MEYLFPARAGVIPKLLERFNLKETFPRASGGNSLGIHSNYYLCGFSPRERG
ncbi:hypothetical protein HMPREF3198_02035 [Winkia neuii]|nr:hypothetical protein HMPREF3198_02035 [Winkia neuii]